MKLRSLCFCDGQDEDTARTKEAEALHVAYEALVQALGVIPEAKAPPRRLAAWLTDHVAASLSLRRDDLAVEVEERDATGPLLSNPACEAPRVVYARVVLQMGSQGAVAVGDTFVYTPQETAYQLLTGDGCAPYFRAWAGKGLEDLCAARLGRAAMDGHLGNAGPELGKAVGGLMGPAYAITPSRLYPVMQGQLRIYESGKSMPKSSPARSHSECPIANLIKGPPCVSTPSGLALLRTGVSPMLVSFARNVSDVRCVSAK
jgi:hypothetical protein